MNPNILFVFFLPDTGAGIWIQRLALTWPETMAKLSPAHDSKKMNALTWRAVQTDGHDCNKTCLKK